MVLFISKITVHYPFKKPNSIIMSTAVINKPNFPELKQSAWDSLSGLWGRSAVAALIFMIYIGLGQIPVAGIIITLIIGGPLALGVTKYFMNIARGNEAEVSQVFDGFSNFANAFVANILIFIGSLIGFILLIVPGVIFILGVSMTWFIMNDEPDISGLDAVKKSWAMMKGYKGNYFVLALTFIGWILLGLVTAGLGFLFVYPYLATTMANYYDEIKHTNFDGLATDENIDLDKHLVP